MMKFFCFVSCFLTLTAHAAFIRQPFPLENDREFERDFQKFSQDQIGIVPNPTNKELLANLKLLAEFMADAVTVARDDLDIERMREITVRIYQIAKAQTRLPNYKLQHRLAVNAPTTMTAAFGLMIAHSQNSEAAAIGALGGSFAAALAVGILLDRAYIQHKSAATGLTTALFQPSELLARAIEYLASSKQERALQTFWRFFLAELEERGHKIDIPQEHRSRIEYLENLISEKVGLSLNCERLVVRIEK